MAVNALSDAQPTLTGSDFDLPFGNSSGAGLIFGATGLVMEAALRSAVEMVTGLKAETLWGQLWVEDVRGFEDIKYMELTILQVRSIPGLFEKAQY